MAELDALVDRIIDEHYSRNLDAIACPGFGVPPTSEAIRDAFFAGLRVGAAAALEDRDRLRAELDQYGRHQAICAMEQWFRANLSSHGRMGDCPDCTCGWSVVAALEGRDG